MSIKRERTKIHKIMDDSCLASEDLSSFHLCMVLQGGAATGNMTVGAPGGQGVQVYAALLNAPEEDAIAQLQVYGIAEIKAGETISAGDEVTVLDATGVIEAAASGDYVIGWAREAALAANHCISVTLCMGYYKP